MERALLVGLKIKGKKNDTTESSLKELQGLLETVGGESAGLVIQERPARDPATLLGKGKVVEIAEWVRRDKIGTVVVNDDLSPTQQQNWQELVPAKVIDRTRLILDIFAQRARTREGQLQVELAQLNYLLPRVTEKFGRFEQQVGGIGTRGPGERKLEISQRRIRDRITRLKKDIDGVRQHRSLQRENRKRLPMPLVALVGYTNVGKSSLLNRLHTSHATDVYADDKLFATLDPTTRRARLPGGRNALLVDTVGFIQHLPHHLVAAFHATLEEARDANLLVHVMDVSHPDWSAQRDVVRDVLSSLDANHVPVLEVFNKVDRLTPAERAVHVREGRLLISVHTGEGIDALGRVVEEKLDVGLEEHDILIPHDHGQWVSRVHDAGRVISKESTPDGVRMRALLDAKSWGQLQKDLHL